MYDSFIQLAKCVLTKYEFKSTIPTKILKQLAYVLKLQKLCNMIFISGAEGEYV